MEGQRSGTCEHVPYGHHKPPFPYLPPCPDPDAVPRAKLFSDPVHGFVSVPRGLVFDLVESPEVQRLRRIRQLGVGHLVFPGAEHTRFGHALGTMALMQEALDTLAETGTPVSPDERTAALAAALLHDIGHGPFSHTLEFLLLGGQCHEAMSRALMRDLDARHGGALALTLALFDGTYERPFFHALVSGQLDVDRLDYLRRDAFHTGVVEGEVGVARLIRTLAVEPPEGGPGSRLVVESKGRYAVEAFLVARRLMYWQVYLHKTVLAGDHVLRGALLRVREHLRDGRRGASRDACSAPLLFFLDRDADARVDVDDPEVRRAFCNLDDADVLVSLKRWRDDRDPVLADLAGRFLDRRLPAVTWLDAPPTDDARAAWTDAVTRHLVAEGLSTPASVGADLPYYLAFEQATNTAYARRSPIVIRHSDGRVRDFHEVADMPSEAGGLRISRPYIVHPKGVAPA